VCSNYLEVVIRCVALTAAAVAALTLLLPARAGHWPTTREAQRFRFPHRWLVDSGVWCIHRHEAVDWHETRNPNSRGGMQIVWSTWSSVGGSGDPAAWSVREQVYRAYLIWFRDGGSFREWTTAGACHLG
jgi:hypothetical protein